MSSGDLYRDALLGVRAGDGARVERLGGLETEVTGWLG
jgi:hypothetical protein